MAFLGRDNLVFPKSHYKSFPKKSRKKKVVMQTMVGRQTFVEGGGRGGIRQPREKNGPGTKIQTCRPARVSQLSETAFLRECGPVLYDCYSDPILHVLRNRSVVRVLELTGLRVYVTTEQQYLITIHSCNIFKKTQLILHEQGVLLRTK